MPKQLTESTNRKFLAINRTLAISHEKGRRDLLQRTSSPAWPKKIVRDHFDVSRILETWKSARNEDEEFWNEETFSGRPGCNNRNGLNGAKRLNGWNDWNSIDCEQGIFLSIVINTKAKSKPPKP